VKPWKEDRRFVENPHIYIVAKYYSYDAVFFCVVQNLVFVADFPLLMQIHIVAIFLFL
jgi:hypothetical protein